MESLRGLRERKKSARQKSEKKCKRKRKVIPQDVFLRTERKLRDQDQYPVTWKAVRAHLNNNKQAAAVHVAGALEYTTYMAPSKRTKWYVRFLARNDPDKDPVPVASLPTTISTFSTRKKRRKVFD